MSHNDWLPTLCAIAGEPDIVNKAKKGYTANGKNYKVHLDGYDQSKFLTSVDGTVGKNNGAKSARKSFFYSNDDGLLVGLRIGDYKLSFAEQRMPGLMAVWAEPFTVLRLTKVYNLMQDPFERADITSNTYWDWIMNHVPQVYQGMEEVPKFVESFKEFPPRSQPPIVQPGQHDGRNAARHQSEGKGRAGISDVAAESPERPTTNSLRERSTLRSTLNEEGSLR